MRTTLTMFPLFASAQGRGLPVAPKVEPIQDNSFPIGVGPSRGERALFLYLSFEHPSRKTT